MLTPDEIREKRQQLQVYLDWFGAQLSYVMVRMPVRGALKKDGQFEILPPAPEWQKLIDELTETQDAFLKANFPEFYENL